MGHSEPASGLCSLVKVLIAMEAGTIPANLHFKSPNKDIPSLLDGRLALETMPRDDDLITLLHDIHKQNVNGHPYRGYTVLGAATPIKECDVSITKFLMVHASVAEYLSTAVAVAARSIDSCIEHFRLLRIQRTGCSPT
ncbi:unnamed protein product [Nesidiocoris tenuis]|uniref:Beta-ketoacyl synthase C-terminal domain-containing protein n=1 Tax=Nesidiocoris tenuis TaxID=355587 RepID=A0A6H5G3D9_9HEMI|nr:unnamed protein product [Nesidiocoris tenuis]